MRLTTYLILAFLALTTMGQSQTYIFGNTDANNEADIILSIDAEQPTNELKLELGGYLEDNIQDVIIITEVGINVEKWESLQSKEATLDISRLERQRPYLLHLKTSSGEVFIEKFVKV